MTYVLAEASGLSKVAVGKFAEQVAAHLEFRPCDDMNLLISKLGGRIEYANTFSDDAEHGSLFVDAASDFKIIVPIHTSPNRDRFTIAHELGHYFLHFVLPHQQTGAPLKLKALRKGSERVEWEANWFAASFLMPEQEFRQTFAECGGRLASVAAKFCVSENAADVRAQTLHCIA